ncbi:uracil-DNA glycosylase family protein [Advenella mimigardefordensis]|nr:uracil-DNA glycosylase family protein [Advenella mimigardefordensis]
MESSSVSAGAPPVVHPANVTLNPLQLLWLQESGIDRLWGRALTVSAPTEPARAAHNKHTHAAEAAAAAESAHGNEGNEGARSAPSIAARPVASALPSPAAKDTAPDAATVSRNDASPARQALAKLREQMQRQRRPAGRVAADTRRTTDEGTGAATAENSAAAISDPMPEAVGPASQGSQPADTLALRDGPVQWPALAETIRQCRRCGLSEHARQAVPGTGNATARLMIIDQAPGAQDEISGEPLSGQAGQLLDNMLAAIGLSRDATFITDVVKCRPMVSRPAEPHEIAACSDYLQQQIAMVQPSCLLLFGNAAQSVLGTTQSVGQLRETHDLQLTVQGRTIPVVVTFHPNHLMANQAAKPLAWVDLKRLRKLLQQADA